ncbi:Astacin (Peptidase M12A) [Parelaphostrongylus tenuis]|uniref:Astacin (Peptidase M12A) n=1 Tax=Parelaphostrongylus tenuis TaxID=148309 RepID=A0AAD5WKP3_PARTN|nr:Astacin (Peptidase M12A) [Parelaphostrongylus tenuis]
MVNLHYKCLGEIIAASIFDLFTLLFFIIKFILSDKCPKESWKKCENGGFLIQETAQSAFVPADMVGHCVIKSKIIEFQCRCREVRNNLFNLQPPGCGKELIATDDYQELWDVVGQEVMTDMLLMTISTSATTGFGYISLKPTLLVHMKNLSLKGPPGSKIEVIFQNYTEDLDYPGCVWAGVEIKTLEDQRLTGYR